MTNSCKSHFFTLSTSQITLLKMFYYKISKKQFSFVRNKKKKIYFDGGVKNPFPSLPTARDGAKPNSFCKFLKKKFLKLQEFDLFIKF